MMLNSISIEEGLALITALNSAKPACRLPTYARHAEATPQSEQDGVNREEEFPCFGSSAVYNCTKNCCSEYQMMCPSGVTLVTRLSDCGLSCNETMTQLEHFVGASHKETIHDGA
jgi:hypothetical protein